MTREDGPNPQEQPEEVRGEALWSTRLSGSYQLRLETTDDQRTSRLRLIHTGTGVVLLDELVALPAGATYGLAEQDLQRWQKRGWRAVVQRTLPPFARTPTRVQEQHEQEIQDLEASQQETPNE